MGLLDLNDPLNKKSPQVSGRRYAAYLEEERNFRIMIEAVKLRESGHTFNQIAERLGITPTKASILTRHVKLEDVRKTGIVVHGKTRGRTENIEPQKCLWELCDKTFIPKKGQKMKFCSTQCFREYKFMFSMTPEQKKQRIKEVNKIQWEKKKLMPGYREYCLEQYGRARMKLIIKNDPNQEIYISSCCHSPYMLGREAIMKKNKVTHFPVSFCSKCEKKCELVKKDRKGSLRYYEDQLKSKGIDMDDLENYFNDLLKHE